MTKGKVYVIDTSGFIVGVDLSDGTLVTVPGVAEEIIDSSTRLRFDLLRDGGLRVEPPLKIYQEQVRRVAVSTGDVGVLSGTDIDILSKAMEIGEMSHVVLVTDDYAVQNAATAMGIAYMPAGTWGIQKELVWEMKCIGCGNVVESGSKCPICGSAVRRRRAGRR